MTTQSAQSSGESNYFALPSRSPSTSIYIWKRLCAVEDIAPTVHLWQEFLGLRLLAFMGRAQHYWCIGAPGSSGKSF